MSLMLAQMGLAGMGMLSDFSAASNEAKLNRKVQDYQNALRKMEAARQLATVDENIGRVRYSAGQNETMIQRQSIEDLGRAAVAAAAAGVKGNSVDMTTRALEVSAERASYANRRDSQQQIADMKESKVSIAIGSVRGQGTQIFPKPSVGAALLGAGANMLSIYESHQPEGI